MCKKKYVEPQVEVVNFLDFVDKDVWRIFDGYLYKFHVDSISHTSVFMHDYKLRDEFTELRFADYGTVWFPDYETAIKALGWDIAYEN